ncbi:MAG TPA: beta-phosphoglucomutase family hydrolase [Candidatus Binatia bacterium]|nr:beta-phosphoglucomutase family hydrolase [Candidatus Binatia bacterium]
MRAPEKRLLLHVSRFGAGLFDLDGVLTRTARVHAAAWTMALDEFLARRAGGQRFQAFDAERDYRAWVDGKPRQDGVRDFLASRGLRLPEGAPSDPPGYETVWALANRKDALFAAALRRQGVDVVPGAPELVRELRRAGLRLAVVSASRHCGEVLDAAGMRALFDAQMDGLEMARLGLRGKPAPDTFLAAAARLGVPPPRAFVVEDALAGVEAGRRGGFALVVGVDAGAGADALRARGADVVVRSVADLVVVP